MVNFYVALEDNGFDCCNQVLIARDIPGEYKKLMTHKTVSDKTVLIYNTKEDITDLCREEEKRMEKLTGEPTTIDDQSVAAVFFWNRTFGVVSDEPRSVGGWERYFKMDTNAPCIICMEAGKRRTVCGNCTSTVCIECDRRIEGGKCPGCTLEML